MKVALFLNSFLASSYFCSTSSNFYSEVSSSSCSLLSDKESESALSFLFLSSFFPLLAETTDEIFYAFEWLDDSLDWPADFWIELRYFVIRTWFLDGGSSFSFSSPFSKSIFNGSLVFSFGVNAFFCCFYFFDLSCLFIPSGLMIKLMEFLRCGSFESSYITSIRFHIFLFIFWQYSWVISFPCERSWCLV